MREGTVRRPAVSPATPCTATVARTAPAAAFAASAGARLLVPVVQDAVAVGVRVRGGEGALQVLLFHAREVQEPHDHPGVGDAEDDRLALERVRGPEFPDLRRQEIGIRHLSLSYRAGR